MRGEGWAWVTVAPEFDHRMTADLRRVYPLPAALSDKAQRKLDKLTADYDALVGIVDAEGETEELAARLVELDEAIDTLQGAPVFEADDIGRGGAFVSLGYDGGVRIERGFVRKADAAPAATDTAEANPTADRVSSAALPEKLVAQLTAHRTLALREAVANRPDIAFVAVVHALAVATFYVGSVLSGYQGQQSVPRQSCAWHR